MSDSPPPDPPSVRGAPVANPAGESPNEAIVRVLAALDRWLFGLSFGRFCLLILTTVVLQNGIWIVPIIGRICRIASDVTRRMTAESPYFDYLYTSFLDLLVGYWTGLWRSGPAFAVMHLVILGVGGASLLGAVRRKFGDPTARLFALAFATVPLSNVLLTWLGLSDVYVFFFSTALVLAERAPALAGLAFLLGLSHFEQGFLIVCGLAAARMYQCTFVGRHLRDAVVPVASMFTGVLGARLGLGWYFARQGFHFTTTRLGAVTWAHWHEFLPCDAQHFGTLIFSLHGCYWLVVLGLVLSRWQARRGLAWGIIAVQTVFTGVALLTLDETRVFSLIAWPLLVFLLRPDVTPTAQLRGSVVAAFAGGLLVPKLIVWGGHVHSSSLYHGLQLCLRLVSGHGLPDDPNWMMAPFR